MTERTEAPAPDLAQFHALFDDLGRFGATPKGGLHRLAAGHEDGQARDRLCELLQQSGMAVRIDAIGNIFGLCEWSPGADFLLVGSHLDSQPWGGRFDGAYGVVAALSVAIAHKAAVDHGQPAPPLNLAVVNWTNEEGARFRPSLTGSSVYTGTLSEAEAHALVDDDGTRLDEALGAIGYLGQDTPPTPAGCVEIHNELGRLLENEAAPIGAVTRNWGARKYELVFHGEQAHTGPTLMADRRDALVAASQMIVATRRLADLYPDEQLRTSVGRAVISPNSANVVPARVAMSVELRSPESAILDDLDQRVRALWPEIEADTGCSVELVKQSARQALNFWPGGVAATQAAAEALGYACRELDTVAGHDVVAVMNRVPGVLINVPSYRGFGHNEAEYTDPESLGRGVEVLSRVVWQLLHDDPRQTGNPS